MTSSRGRDDDPQAPKYWEIPTWAGWVHAWIFPQAAARAWREGFGVLEVRLLGLSGTSLDHRKRKERRPSSSWYVDVELEGQRHRIHEQDDVDVVRLFRVRCPWAPLQLQLFEDRGGACAGDTEIPDPTTFDL